MARIDHCLSLGLEPELLTEPPTGALRPRTLSLDLGDAATPGLSYARAPKGALSGKLSLDTSLDASAATPKLAFATPKARAGCLSPGKLSLDTSDASTVACTVTPSASCALLCDLSDDDWDSEATLLSDASWSVCTPKRGRPAPLDISTTAADALARSTCVNVGLLQSRAPVPAHCTPRRRRVKAFAAEWQGVAEGLEFPAPVDKAALLEDLAAVEGEQVVIDEFTGMMFGRKGMYRLNR